MFSFRASAVGSLDISGGLNGVLFDYSLERAVTTDFDAMLEATKSNDVTSSSTSI